MRIAFVRTHGARDRIYVTRRDGSEVSWAFPTCGDRLPHDLVRYVVEHAMDRENGFWGRVASGIDPGRATAEANRLAGPDTFAGLGPDLAALAVAEAWVNAPWSEDDPEVLSWVATWCERCGVEPPPPPAPALLRHVRALLATYRARWRDLSDRSTIDVVW